MAQFKDPYITVDDLTGGINDLDSPFSIDDNQVVEAKNLDFRRGQIGTKRNGLSPLTLTGSAFLRARPRIATTNKGGFTAAGSGNIAVSAYANTTDGTGNTNHCLIVFITVNNLVGTITSVTLGATPLAALQTNPFGTAGRISVYGLFAPSLAGGTLTVTLNAAPKDCAIVAQRWTEVDTSLGILLFDTGAKSGTSTDPTDGFAWFGSVPGTMLVGGVSVAPAPTITAVTGGQINSQTQTNGGARMGTSAAILTSSPNQLLWTLSSAVDWATVSVRLPGRNDVTTRTLGTTGTVSVIMHTSPSNVVTEDELWAFDTWGRLDRFVGGSWGGAIPRINSKVGLFVAGSYDTNIVNLHGKVFFAMVPGTGGIMEDRLTVWDGTNLRWAGIAAPGAFASATANTGGGAYPNTPRYYRARWIAMSGTTILRRSEPNTSVAFTPSGAGTAARVTMPTLGTYINGNFEGQTHWELEASTDNVLFYRIATTVVGTTTYDDSALVATYSSNPLSEDIGEYIVPTAPRHVAVDQDRLLTGGSVFTAIEDSRVRWTELRAADGVGNDERIPITTRHYQDLDALDGGRLTHMIAGQMGGVYVFKLQKIYKVVASGAIDVAYRVIHNTNARGCLPRAGDTATNPDGNPTIYFVDPNVGVCTFGDGGVKDLMRTRVIPSRINRLQTVLNARVLVHPNEWLVWVWLALDGATLPNYMCCYNVLTNGWTDYNGRMSQVVSATSYLANNVYEPYVALGSGFGTAANSSYSYQADIGASDGTGSDAVYYRGFIVTKPYQRGGLYKLFSVLGATLHALKSAATTIGIGLLQNFGAITRKDVTTSIAGVGAETYIVAPMDDATTDPVQFVQFEIGDPLTFSGSQLAQTWTLDELVAKVTSDDEVPG